MDNDIFNQGVESAYTEVHAAIESDDHPRICGGNCRPCNVMRATLEKFLLQLGKMMDPDDFQTFVGIIAKLTQSRTDERGNV